MMSDSIYLNINGTDELIDSAYVEGLLTQLTAERAAHEETKRRLEASERELGKWRNWLPDDDSLAEMKQQYEGGTNVGRIVYVGALEVRLKSAEAKLADLEAQIAKSREQEPHHWLLKPSKLNIYVSLNRRELSLTGLHNRHWDIEAPYYASPIIPPSTAELIEQARKEENEACAKVCEELWDLKESEVARMHAAKCVAAIKARAVDANNKSLQIQVYQWAKSAGIFDANHLEKIQDELNELKERPNDEQEMADVFLALMLHAEQFGCLDLIGAVWKKFEIVKSRKYGEPDERGVIRHIEQSEQG